MLRKTAFGTSYLCAVLSPPHLGQGSLLRIALLERMNWSNAKTIILENNKVQKELKKNEAEYKIIEEIILARREKNLSQKAGRAALH